MQLSPRYSDTTGEADSPLRRQHMSLRHSSSTYSYSAPGKFPQDYDDDDAASMEAAHELQQFLPQQRNVLLSNGPRSIRKRWCGRTSDWGFHCRDCYHTLVEMPAPVVLLMYSVLYFILIVVFAGIYVAMTYPEDLCALGTHNMSDAMLFSSITITTVGYGSNSLFFNGCTGVTVVITIQILIGFMMNAFLLGLMYTKCARGGTRKYSVRFSEKVMIRQIRGEWYFMFRVCEMRTSQILEAHIRAYCIRDETDAEMLNAGRAVPFMFQQYPLGLSHPDDDLGAPMLLMLPVQVVHRIDLWSPLSYRNFLYIPTKQYDPQHAYKWPDKRRSLADVEVDGQLYTCEFCGESYRSRTLLARHIRINAAQDHSSGYQEEGATDAMMQVMHKWDGWSDTKHDMGDESEDDSVALSPAIGADAAALAAEKAASGEGGGGGGGDDGQASDGLTSDNQAAPLPRGADDAEVAEIAKSPLPRPSTNAESAPARLPASSDAKNGSSTPTSPRMSPLMTAKPLSPTLKSTASTLDIRRKSASSSGFSLPSSRRGRSEEVVLLPRRGTLARVLANGLGQPGVAATTTRVPLRVGGGEPFAWPWQCRSDSDAFPRASALLASRARGHNHGQPSTAAAAIAATTTTARAGRSAAPRDADELREQMSSFRNFTILVLLEGVDPNASCTLQCRKIYSMADFVFSHDFAPCTHAEEDGRCTIDFGLFDEFVEVPDDPLVPDILRHH